MNNQIGTRIRKIRENKGLSQEAMAFELEITQSNYGRLEKCDTRLTAPKIQKIAKVLDVAISYLFDEKSAKIINQHNNDSSQTPQAYNVDAIINSGKEHINTLKDEIKFLRDLLKKNN